MAKRYIKKDRKVLCKPARVKYAFIHEHRREFSVLSMCRVFKLNRSGFYAWLNKLLSARAIEDNRLLKLIKTFYIASGGTYGKPSRIADNLLVRQFNPEESDKIWLSDITYISTYEGLLYVVTAMDLFSRRIIGWSMDKNRDKCFVINALLMAEYRRHPKQELLIHSDQESQYESAGL